MIINKAQLKENYDIVIIGAGIAGLALSQLLKLEEKNILLVESGDFKSVSYTHLTLPTIYSV